MKDIELEAFAGEVNKFVSERLEPVSEKVSELTERLDDIAKQPAPVNGQDGKDGADGAKGDTGEKGADGLGLDIPVYAEGVYREGSIVQANFGQAFRALVDTAKGVDSEDWERIGTHGFRLTGPYSADKTYQPGDLFIKDFGLFLHDGNEAKLIAGRGPEGKKGKQGPAGKDGVDGQDGADGKDGSQIEAMEIKGTSLVLVVKDADGEVKSFDTDLAPFLDAAVEVTKSLTEDTTKAQAAEVEAQVKNLWNHFQEHLTDQQAIPVRFFRGLWTTAVSYQTGDMVKYSTGLYVAKRGSTSIVPHGQLNSDINSSDYWAQLTSEGGGGGGGDIDLTGYVKRPVPALRDGRWLAYRETEGGKDREWSPITTDMVETNGMIMFRDSLGRFQPTPEELGELTTQLKVNRFLWDKIQQLDGNGSSGEFVQKWAMQLRGTFELDADGKVIIPDDVIYESDNDPDAERYADYKRAGVWWTNSTISTGYLPKQTNRLLIASNTYLDAELEGDRWIYLEKEMQPLYQVGDYIRVRVETLEAYNDGSDAEFIQDSLDNIWKITKVLEINNDTGFNDTWLGMQAFEVEKCLDERFYYGSYNISPFEEQKQFAPCRVSQSVYATFEHSEHRDNLLQAEIEELTLVVGDALQASQQEHGAWSYSGDGLQAYPSQEGTFTLGSNNLGGTIENNVVFNTTDLDGGVHGFGDIEVGEYLEIVDEEHPEQYALWVVDAEPAVNGTLADIKVKLKKAGKEGFDLNDRCQVRFIQIQESNLDLAELDKRYAGKEAEHLNISHQAENTAWYNAPHKLGTIAANIQTEAWDGSYERLKHDGQKGLLAFTSKSPTAAGSITWKSWTQLTEGSEYYLRNTDSRLDSSALKKLAAEDIGSVIVMRQPSTGAELSLHVKNTNTKNSGDTEHAAYVHIRRRRGSPSEDGEWRVYLQKEYLSAKGHDHYVGRLNTREERILKKWKSLSSNEFSLSEATGTPEIGNGCYSWNRGRWFKIYSGQFSTSSMSGDYNNGLGIVTVQSGNTIYCGYLTLSEVSNYNGDHSWRTQSFMGQYETSPITEWEQTFTVATNGLIQNSRTQFKNSTYTNVYTEGSPDEDIENPERPVWTGDNFGDFKSLNDFVAELKSADPEGSSIEFLMEQWQTYWYTPGR